MSRMYASAITDRTSDAREFRELQKLLPSSASGGHKVQNVKSFREYESKASATKMSKSNKPFKKQNWTYLNIN